MRLISLFAIAALAVAPVIAQEHDAQHDPGQHAQHDEHQGKYQPDPDAEEPEADGDRLHTFEETSRWVEMFERPERAETQKPEEVVAALGLQPGQTVADVGAGTGYFTFHLAREVGSSGRVLAVDIEEGMLEHIQERAADEEGGEIVETILAAFDDPHLPDGQVDLVLFVNTYHHLSERIDYLNILKGDLKPGGRVAIVDYRKEDLPVGPPLGHKLSRQQVMEEFAAAGFDQVAEETFLDYQYFLIFKP
jgi:ubiquinone/menaquinone biosynthesis C-methylase UbiE